MPTSSTPPARKTSTADSVTALWLNRFSLPLAGWREALRHEAREQPAPSTLFLARLLTPGSDARCGEHRLAFIAKRAGLGPHWDERNVRRLIARPGN